MLLSLRCHAESRHSSDVLDMSGQQQLVHHVQDDRRRRAIEGKSLPGFGKRQVEKSLWMSKERLLVCARHAVIAI
jgi:hypothetical protein